MKRSKRYTNVRKQVTTASAYPLKEAVGLVKSEPVKFDASVELHVRLGIDPKQSDQIVRGSVELPHGTGKSVRVIAFVEADKEAEAKEAGADIVGTAEVIAEIKKTGKTDFDVAVATPGMMKQIGVIARTLGQRGMMPNPKTDTVGQDVAGMVGALKRGKVNYKNDSTANVHMAVGKLSFTDEQIIENIEAALDSLKKAKSSASKGVFLQKITICSTMGPGIQVNA